MTIHPLAAKPPPEDILVDVAKLRQEYYAGKPDVANPSQRVGFGTSGHRGSSLRGTFNEAHVLAITPLWRCSPPTAWRR
jgi:phosphoglucomutase